MSSPAPLQKKLPADRIASIVGVEHCSTELGERRLYSTDLSFQPGQIADIVVRPANTEELAACVAIAAEAGMAVVPRGGGMSYTQGYQPERSHTSIGRHAAHGSQSWRPTPLICIVRVQAGCTWKKLFEALGDAELPAHRISDPSPACMRPSAVRYHRTVCSLGSGVV